MQHDLSVSVLVLVMAACGSAADSDSEENTSGPGGTPADLHASCEHRCEVCNGQPTFGSCSCVDACMATLSSMRDGVREAYACAMSAVASCSSIESTDFEQALSACEPCVECLAGERSEDQAWVADCESRQTACASELGSAGFACSHDTEAYSEEALSAMRACLDRPCAEVEACISLGALKSCVGT